MMSDPAGKGEIEDVIASIRRLVQSAPNAQRLVLTEAFRVDGGSPDDRKGHAAPDRAAAGQGGSAGPDAAGDGAGPSATAVSLEKALAELEAELAVDAAIGGREARYDPWEPVDPAPREAAAAEPDGIEIDLDVADTAEAEVVVFSRAAAAGRSLGAEPDSSRADPAGAPAAGAADAPKTPPAGGNADAAQADRAVLYRANSAAAEAGRVFRPVAPDVPPQGVAENVAAPDADSLLDEHELRALVAEVLREELKGPLGERITRNVRKLVRREIAQALANYDLG